GGSAIDDDSLALVAEMKNLTGLALEDCFVTDEAIAKLGNLPLADLALYKCPLATDTGLAVLARYDNLRKLTLSDVGAKGSALALLPHPEKLVSLNMAQSRITDAEVAHLAKMTNLEILNLNETGITDAAVDTLSTLTSLGQLHLSQTGITEAGMERLRAALPNCAIREY
ncbi:MAG: hypothetical protein HQ581_07135, partial [Planctomycetes bacterium]|nr:hypothetical protein [Planctomycetota bacterium]